MPEVSEEAKLRGVELIAVPTSEACRLLGTMGKNEANAILHVTC
jgi:hypothetical protein